MKTGSHHSRTEPEAPPPPDPVDSEFDPDEPIDCPVSTNDEPTAPVETIDPPPIAPTGRMEPEDPP